MVLATNKPYLVQLRTSVRIGYGGCYLGPARGLEQHFVQSLCD